MLKTIVINVASSIHRGSDEFSISQFSGICHLHDLDKNILNFQIVLYVAKILQNFWLTLVQAHVAYMLYLLVYCADIEMFLYAVTYWALFRYGI